MWIITVGYRLFKASNRKCLDIMAVQCTTQALLAGPRVLSHHNTLQYTGSLILQDHNPSTLLPYSLKISRLKIFAVFADYGCTTKILSREIFTYIYSTCKRNTICGRGHLPVRALNGHRSRTACMLVPTGCRYRR